MFRMREHSRNLIISIHVPLHAMEAHGGGGEEV
jgi:hypothetical protein